MLTEDVITTKLLEFLGFLGCCAM